MKFIHTGDLHLDSPFRGLQEIPHNLWQRIHQSTFTAFEKIVDDAIDLRVDFILIAGDIYDRDEHSISAENFFITQCQRLADNKIPVFLLYGNHDYQIVRESKLLPTNVFVFPNHVTTKKFKINGTSIAISGFSYDQRWIDEDKIKQYPHHANVTWHIGMLHGAQKQATAGNHYAPFSIKELQQKNYDYWALGHIHKHGTIASSPTIAYCGTPQGRNKNENGPHGYYLVEENNGSLVPQFNAVDTIRWEAISTKLGQLRTVDEVEDLIASQIANRQLSGIFELVSIRILTEGNLPEGVRHLLVNGDMLAHLQDRFSQQNKVWPYELVLDEEQVKPQMAELDQQYWEDSAKEVFSTSNIMSLSDSFTKEEFLARKLAQVDSDQLEKMVIKLLIQGDMPDDN